MVTSDFGLITNWTSLTKFIVAPGATVSCHSPCGNPQLPLNVAVIFRADPTTIVCAHNIKSSKVKARAQSAGLFKKTFKLLSAK